MPNGDRLRRSEAEARAERVMRPAYRLHLDLRPGAKTYQAEAQVSFSAAGEGDLFLDFSGGTIAEALLNGESFEPEWDGHRLVLPADRLEQSNELRVAYENPYDHGGEGFHQFVDPEDGGEYLYTQFEPYQAHRLFPCFDQPDLKATYALTVDAPAEWEVITNTRPEGEEDLGEGRRRRRFEESLPFSTYLVAVVAGPYQAVRDAHRGLPLGLYCRRSLLRHLEEEELFEVTRRGLDFYEDFFAHPYPFTKYDQVFVPEFNWGGMENVGAVTYADGYLFRDPPTATDRLRRVEVFLHELAHMWFGNLVTMRWWDDLWLNESFASYMAYLATDEATRFVGSWQNFQWRMKLWAYRQDELVTTHQIADRVPSTDETFLNFDGITYGKGAAVIKQLVASIGLEGFRAGMRRYFQRHAYGNATLGDFLAALQEGSGLDLEAWAKAWLETRSLNRLSCHWREEEGQVAELELRQEHPEEHPHLRPHVVEVALVGEEGRPNRTLRVRIEEERAAVPEAAGLPAPRLVFPNHGDHAYAKVRLDPASLEALPELLPRIEDPLLRQLLWSSLWTMVRDGELGSLRYLDLVHQHLPTEADLQVLEMVIALTAGILGTPLIAPDVLGFYVPEERRAEEAHRFFETGRAALASAPQGDARALWARGLLGQAAQPEDLERAGRLVDGREEVAGLAIDQDMRWEVAVRWVAHGVPGSEDRLAAEGERDPTDRGQRALARAEASPPDPEVKAEVWERIHAHGYPSLHLARSAMSGFNWPHQRELLIPYVERFFAGLVTVFDTWEREAAKQCFQRMFPWYRVDGEVLDRTQDLLAEVGDDRPMLRRLLLEAADDLSRAVACRAVAS